MLAVSKFLKFIQLLPQVSFLNSGIFTITWRGTDNALKAFEIFGINLLDFLWRLPELDDFLAGISLKLSRSRLLSLELWKENFLEIMYSSLEVS